jgi:hypothetical protein
VTARRRDDLVRAQRAQPPFGGRTFGPDAPAVRVGITGTGDDLLLLAWSAGDLARERAAGARVLGRAGVRAGEPVGNALPGALATPGALLVGDVSEEIGALDVPVGVVETEAEARAAWALLDRVGVGVVILDPARAAPLLAHAPAVERPWWRGIVWLERPDDRAGRPAIPESLRGWQRRWLAVPEVASFVASTCTADRFHVDDDVAVDLVDGTLVVERRAGGEGALATGRAATLAPTCPCGGPGPVVTLA